MHADMYKHNYNVRWLCYSKQKHNIVRLILSNHIYIHLVTVLLDPLYHIYFVTNKKHSRMHILRNTPDSKVRVANMGPTWVLAAPGRPHVDPMNLAISDTLSPLCSASHWLCSVVMHSATGSEHPLQYSPRLCVVGKHEHWRTSVIVLHGSYQFDVNHRL